MSKDCGNCTHRVFDKETGLSCGITGQKPSTFDACLNYEPDVAAIEIEENNATEIPSSNLAETVAQAEESAATADVQPLTKRRAVLSIVLGLATGLVLSCLWAWITVLTEKQYGIMPLVIGFLVGLVIRHTSKNDSIGMGIVAAVIALASCFIGDFLTGVYFIGQSEEMGFFETLASINWKYFFEIATLGFDGMTILFYFFAIYEAFSLVHRKKKETL